MCRMVLDQLSLQTLPMVVSIPAVSLHRLDHMICAVRVGRLPFFGGAYFGTAVYVWWGQPAANVS
jgi:hypothetical protein